MPGGSCKPEPGASPDPLHRTLTPTEPESPRSSWSQDAQPRELFPPTPKQALPSPPTPVSAVKSAPPVPKPTPIARSASMQPPPTPAAISRRLSRAMEPNARGEFKIAENIRQQYNAGGDSKEGVIRLFAKCGYNTDGLLSCCVGHSVGCSIHAMCITCIVHHTRRTCL